MSVVMPQGHALQAPNVGLGENRGRTTMFHRAFQDLLEEVVPLVERNYRACNPDNRDWGCPWGRPSID
jgi:hypothetical protein